MKTNEQSTPQNGPLKNYYKTGELLSEGHYKDGKKTGEWKSYNEDGSLKKTHTFNAT
jgi:antitoxin component YwqK of YwqJK toxin-antitoxin module